MEFIYSRVSTNKQDADSQLSRLKEMYPNAQIHEEVASGAKRRPVLEELIKGLKEGDVLVVAALDRLGRRTSEILTLIEDLQKRKIVLKSVREGMDYSTPAGKLVTQVLVACAELERNLISQRTKEALAAKRKQGIVGGRPPIYSIERIEAARGLKRAGKTYREIAEATGMSLKTAWRLANKAVA